MPKKSSPITIQISTQVPDWKEYQVPYGYLTSDRECLALFYYAMYASKAYQDHESRLFIENKEPPPPNYKQLFQSCAMAYGADVEKMPKHWQSVKMEWLRQGQKWILPEEEQFMFNNPIKVVTN